MLDTSIRLDLQVRSALLQCAKEAALELLQTIERNPEALILIGTGGTMEPVHAEICNLLSGPFRGLDISRVVIVNVDEYVGLPFEHPQSYHTYMDKNLYGKTRFNRNNIYIPNGLGTASDLETECARLNDVLDRYGPADLLLTGTGVGGHLGFNENGTPRTLRTHIVDLTLETRLKNSRFFDGDINQVPLQAITIGPRDLLNAKREIIMINEGKVKAVRAAVGRPDSPAAIRWLRDDPAAKLYVEEKAFPYSMRDLPKWQKSRGLYVPAAA